MYLYDLKEVLLFVLASIFYGLLVAVPPGIPYFIRARNLPYRRALCGLSALRQHFSARGLGVVCLRGSVGSDVLTRGGYSPEPDSCLTAFKFFAFTCLKSAMSGRSVDLRSGQ